jgi:hypothetical protein
VLTILVGRVATCLVGTVAERAISQEWLNGARAAQAGWLNTIA